MFDLERNEDDVMMTAHNGAVLNRYDVQRDVSVFDNAKILSLFLLAHTSYISHKFLSEPRVSYKYLYTYIV